MLSNIFKKAVIASAIVFGSALAAHAQRGTAEVAAGGGLASFHANGQTSNKGEFVASASYNFLSAFSLGFEYAFTPISSQSARNGSASATATEHLNSFGGLARIGLTREVRVQPYIAVSGGYIRDTGTLSVSSGSFSSSQSQSEDGGYFGGGFGINGRIVGGLGVRPEVRYQRVSINGNKLNELTATGSLYYNFGGAIHHERHHRR